MNVRLRTKDAFANAVLASVHVQGEDPSRLWDKLFDLIPREKSISPGSGASFGTYINYTLKPHSFSYMTDIQVQLREVATGSSLEEYDC